MPASATKILIIDDDADLVSLLTDNLQLEGFSPSPAYNGEDGLLKLSQENFDLVILDVMMPGMKGTEVLAKIREHSHIPVIMLTARGDPADRIIGLELGADDYVPKPFTPRELVARIRAILRRTASQESPVTPLVVGPLTVNPAQRRVWVTATKKNIELTSTEFSLFEMLGRNLGQRVSKADIYTQVLGRDMGRYDRAIDVHVSALRHKLNGFRSHDLHREHPGIRLQMSVLDDSRQLISMQKRGFFSLQGEHLLADPCGSDRRYDAVRIFGIRRRLGFSESGPYSAP